MEQDPKTFNTYLQRKDSLEIQIIYTMIDRDVHNVPSFRSFYFNVDSTRYFYPASTVKLPMALLALEKINSLQLAGLNKFTPMFHDSVYVGQVGAHADTTSENGLPSVAHYIRKILVVSDNDAYNRLYEWVGQEAANRMLREKGYSLRLLHRLERPLSPDQNRHTEAIRFLSEGRAIYHQPMLVNADSIRPPVVVKKGSGYYRGDSLIREPFDFTYKNFYSLTDQQHILRALLFPETVSPHQRFNLTPEDYRFVYQYMSQLPGETRYPPYGSDSSYYDAYCKFFMYGDDRAPMPDHIRIFNKVGDAYGYLIDNAYIVDFENNLEFMIAAVINCNTDGIYNDSKYAYEQLGYPFFRHLGRSIYQYELKRKRAHRPDLTKFRLAYDQSPAY